LQLHEQKIGTLDHVLIQSTDNLQSRTISPHKVTCENANIALLILHLNARRGERSVAAPATRSPVESLPVKIK